MRAYQKLGEIKKNTMKIQLNQFQLFWIGNFSSSDGPDPSSSDLSADTVIYLGPGDDQTDGEHPPVYLPSMNSGDNRCSMNKALKGSSAEKPSKLPQKKISKRNLFYFIFYQLYRPHFGKSIFIFIPNSIKHRKNILF